MPCIAADKCHEKWVTKPQEFVDWVNPPAKAKPSAVKPSDHLRMATTDPGTRLMLLENMKDKAFAEAIAVPPGLESARDLFLASKITGVRRESKDLKSDASVIQGTLKNCDEDEQAERDVAMWYGELTGAGKKGAEISRDLFAAMYHIGVMYRKGADSWADFSETGLPVASLFSHGGRVLFMLPMSNSAARVALATLLATPKTILQALNPRSAWAFVETTTGGTSGGAKATAKNVAATIVSPIVNVLKEGVLAIGPKMYAAGDDRVYDYFDGGALHPRAAATHSTIMHVEDAEDMPLIKKRHLWITEEKAGGESNIKDSLMGRHKFKNLALGGLGKMNPYSGVTVNKEGGHGHLYVNYRAPVYKLFGSLLVGAEGSAPGVESQFGKAHDSKATKGEFSCTGGRKWSALPSIKLFDKHETKGDVTQFVCDLTDLHTSEAIKQAGQSFTEKNLHEPTKKVKEANWTEMLKRL